ncbi:DUF2461 domain-containing protein [Paremcibacter congregatus]|uniref:DUF2461 domain-containing protein n=1 Tax=Paremcibacter congregatus TaxID=2043170 RepID=UPI0030ED5DA7|tara:strand:- start:7398 stop:8096 length:699 start_codon:yes stop_codon:yes gene_type:complete
MTETFTGFGPAFWSFFAELKQNNNRDWFTDNKARYQQDVVAPISAFITAIAPKLHEISPHYNADPRPNKGSMFRIYRDVRFSKDKRPYKEHAAAQFRHHMGKDAHAPGFYVHLEPGNVMCGGGIWLPPGDSLRQIRERIATRPRKWQAVLENQDFQATFDGVRGDSLKRPPRGFPDDSPHMEDLKRKSFFAMRTFDDDPVVRSNAFVDEVAATFTAAIPLMQFISDAVGSEF